jgi:hypothetical protein
VNANVKKAAESKEAPKEKKDNPVR